MDTDTNICWITPDFPLYLVVNQSVMLYLKRMSSVDADTNIRCFTADFPLYLVVNQCVMLHLKKAICGFRYKQVHHVMSAECPANRCLRRLHSVDSAGNQCIMVYLSRLPSVDWAAKSVLYFMSLTFQTRQHTSRSVCYLFCLSF